MTCRPCDTKVLQPVWCQNCRHHVADPILAYSAGAEINQLQWSTTQPDWVAINFGNKTQVGTLELFQLLLAVMGCMLQMCVLATPSRDASTVLALDVCWQGLQPPTASVTMHVHPVARTADGIVHLNADLAGLTASRVATVSV